MRCLKLAVVSLAFAAACSDSTEPAQTVLTEQALIGTYQMTDSAGVFTPWIAVTGGTVTFTADHRFVWDAPNAPPRRAGSWSISGPIAAMTDTVNAPTWFALRNVKAPSGGRTFDLQLTDNVHAYVFSKR